MSPIVTVQNPAELGVRRSADAACLCLHLDQVQFGAFQELAHEVYCRAAIPARRSAQVVAMRPRNFEEISRHIMTVAVPIDWPMDEPDVD